jgi:transposase
MKTSGLDVHKDTIFCAIYDGKIFGDVMEFDTFTSSIKRLGAYLQSENVKRVAMESTGIYWISVWNILEEMGFELVLVNPFLIKQMPGRKSDVKDAQWIAKLLHKDLLRGSFVPDSSIQRLRSYSRKYMKLQQQITRSLILMDNLLVMSGIRISSCVSDIGGKSTLNVIEALIKGENDPVKLGKLVYGNRENKKNGKLLQALTGNMQEHHRDRLEMEKEQYDLLVTQAKKCLSKMEEICNEKFADAFDLLCTMPGIGHISAMIIIAETGADMKAFESSNKLVGWAGLRPRNDESAGKYKSTAITKGNKYLKATLVQTAWAASRSKGTFFMEKFNRLAIRKSRKKALIAIARKILVTVWHILNEQRGYNPTLLPVYSPEKLSAKVRYHQREIERIEGLIPRKTA